MRHCSQRSASIQPRTSPLKFDDLARRKVRYRTFQLRLYVKGIEHVLDYKQIKERLLDTRAGSEDQFLDQPPSAPVRHIFATGLAIF